MKTIELRQMSEQELKNRLRDEEEGLANLKFQKATSQLESPIKIRVTRRAIARIKTVLRQKQAEAGTPVPTAPEAARQTS